MITIETMKFRTADMIGEEFPLVFWRGKGRIVASDDTSLSLLVRGLRVDLTWDRLVTTWARTLSNHTLTVDELGGGADAVGVVSLFALMQADAVSVLDTDGLLVVDDTIGTPVHQFADVAPHVLGSVASQDPRRLSPATPPHLFFAKGRSAVIRVSRDQSVFSLSADATPVARVQPGESFVLETADCFSDQVQSADAALGGVDWEQINPATGPVYVEGVEPGDVLVVRIDRIEVAARGVMAVSGDFGVLHERVRGHRVRDDPARGRLRTRCRRARPGPADDRRDRRGSGGRRCAVWLAGPARRQHGHAHHRRGRDGLLPCLRARRLLAAGDLHAAMGDGEICGTGVEIQGSIQLTVDVRRDLKRRAVVETDRRGRRRGLR